jgi:hypothetical protein
MPVVHKPASAYGQELRKWEQHHTQYSIDEEGNSRPGNPYVYREFPKMLYRAHQWRNGQFMVSAPPVTVFETGPERFGLAEEEATVFNRSCQKTVHSESEERIAFGQGWRRSPQEAMDLHKKEEWDLAEVAANAAFNASKMSERAHAEFEAAQGEDLAHVPDPAAPKKRGPRKKITVDGVTHG